MEKKNVLLICGGGSTEHEISLLSAQYFKDKFTHLSGYQVYYVCIEKDGSRTNEQGQKVELRRAGEIYNRETKETISLHYAIPCIHGPPGENGQIQAVFELMGLPFLGPGSEASLHCFNKVTTKLWMECFGIPTVPFIVATSREDLAQCETFFKQQQDIYLKASNQGSSVGCYHVTEEKMVKEALQNAFQFSSYVLAEKTIQGRELELATFQYQGKLHVTLPSEICSGGQFYSYEEKYSQESHTSTKVVAPDLSEKQVHTLQAYARKAFEVLKLKDLSRIDFFLSHEGDIYLNEINTFPGHTKISQFPLMMENYGITYENFLKDRLTSAR